MLKNITRKSIKVKKLDPIKLLKIRNKITETTKLI